MNTNLQDNIFNVYASFTAAPGRPSSESKERLLLMDGRIFDPSNQIEVPTFQESEFVNIASMFERPDLGFVEAMDTLSIVNEEGLKHIHKKISSSQFFKLFKGGKHLGVLTPNYGLSTLWIFNDVLTSTWQSEGADDLQKIVSEILST